MKKREFFLLIFFQVIFLYSCRKDSEIKKSDIHYYPEIKLDSVSNILLNSIEAYATFINDGGKKIRGIGFCWGKKEYSSLRDSFLIINDTAIFFSIIKKLIPNTEYFIRAFAYNSNDTTYSNEIFFKTWDGKLMDYDGNIYKGIQIANQGWMAENLKVLHYSDGTPIKTWCFSNDYYWYGEGHAYLSDTEADLDKDGDLDSIDGSIYIKKYGLLYTWYAAQNLYSTSCNGWINKKVTINSSDVCPTGWHLPTESEWQELISYINYDAKVLKSDSLWYTNNGTNDYGFNALPGGGRDYTGEYNNLTATTGFLSSTSANDYNSHHVSIITSSNYIILDIGSKTGAGAVRCIKDK